MELYYGPVDGWGSITEGAVVRMEYEKASDEQGEHWFRGSMSCKKTGQHGVSVRILPRHADLVNPHELGLILWEKTADVQDHNPAEVHSS